MADLPAFTHDELDQTARNLLRTRRRGIDLGVGSDWDLTARLLGAVAWLAIEQGRVARRLVRPGKAFGEVLRQYAFDAGVGRELVATSTAALRATGKVIIRSTTGNQTLVAGSVLRHADGTEYTLDADVTTPATATKVLRAGLRSGRRRLYQGHAGGGFVAAAAEEVYRFAPTGELCALRDTDNGVSLQRHLFDLYNDLDADPTMHDLFSQQLGAVGRITAKKTGASGNKDAKDVLTVLAPTGTLLAEATILTLSGGAEAMAEGEMQAALQALSTARAAIGTVDDIRTILLGYPGASLRECFVMPAFDGVGTFSLLPILEDGQYIGANLAADLAAYLQDRSLAAHYTLTTVYESVDTEIATLGVQVATTFAPDWTLADPTTPGLGVTASTANTLALSAVNGIAIGKRVLIANQGASGPYVVQRRVTSVAALTIGLDTPLPFPADPGQAYVTPGGPLGDAILDALYAAYAQQAPSGPGTRWPPPSVSNDPNAIVAAVSDVPGVSDADYVPGSAPVGSNYGRILVPAMSIIMSVERR